MPPFNLTIKQQGAGNGKTFGLNMLMFNESMQRYANVFMLTKQHSAKTTIKNTFLEVEKYLFDDGVFDTFTYTRQQDECSIDGRHKYYQIGFAIDDEFKMILIATIDSLIYRLANHDNDQKHLNVINHWVQSVALECNNNAQINYGGLQIPLNKQTLLVLDEAQDLDPIYAQALIQVASLFGCDLYVVGDLLQSIAYEQNSLNFFQSLSTEVQQALDMNIIVDEYTNVCRRFKDGHLRDFVNSVVPFERFGLPPIQLNEEISNDSNNLIFLEIPNPSDPKQFTKPIMQSYIHEVETNNRQPNDFMMIFTIVKNLEYPEYLNQLINEFWSNKYQKDSSRYSYFHRGQEGSSINLDESAHATRIVSIHSSKGDGRPVVFVCSISETELSCMDNTKQLRYESLLHVALTRQKEKLFICYSDRMINDDIGSRFNAYIQTKSNKFVPNLTLSMNYKSMLDRMLVENNFRDIRDEIIDHTGYQYNPSDMNTSQIIDMGHHHIRYGTMFVAFILEAFEHLSDQESNMISKSIESLAAKPWHSKHGGCVFGNESTTWFTLYIKQGYLVHLARRGKNDPISNAIYFTSKTVHGTILPTLLSHKPVQICAYEALVFYYMYNTFGSNIDKSVHGWKSPISINELYKITETYYATYTNGMPGHTHCKCAEWFGSKNKAKRQAHMYHQSGRQISKEVVLKEYSFLCRHYESLNHISNAYRSLIKSSSIEWSFYTNFIQTYASRSINPMGIFTLDLNQSGITFIGKEKNQLILVYLRPTYGALNYNNHLLQSIYNEYALRIVLELDNTICIKHVVFTASGHHMYDYSYDNHLLTNAGPTIDRHFRIAYKIRIQLLMNELSSLYAMVYYKLQEANCENTSKRHIAKSKQLLKRSRSMSDQLRLMNYESIVSSKLFESLYKSINHTISPILFKTYMEQLVYDYND